MAEQSEYKAYSYRWIVLLMYAGVALVIQLMWATFFSVTTTAGEYYGFTDPVDAERVIGLLSLIFMIGMLVMSIPSLAAFEKFGYRKSVGFGALLTGVAALARGFWGDVYLAVLICTVAFAIAQPFILNAVGLVAGKWFPANERATANGVGVLASFVGIMLGLIITPVLLEGGMEFKQMLMIYGVIAAAVALFFIIFTKEAPPTPASAEDAVPRSSFTEGLKSLMKKRDFILGAFVFFCTLGVFNTFFTLIEPILNHFSGNGIDPTEIGIVGVITLGAGIVGSIVIPILSDKDKYRRRKPYMVGANLIGFLGFGSIMLMNGFSGFALSTCLYGLFAIGCGPVILTYCAEIAYPTSEGTSEGLLMFAGNVGGVLFLGIAGLFGGNHSLSMGFMFGIFVLCFILLCILKEKNK